jgi:hypothetical protein
MWSLFRKAVENQKAVEDQIDETECRYATSPPQQRRGGRETKKMPRSIH